MGTPSNEMYVLRRFLFHRGRFGLLVFVWLGLGGYVLWPSLNTFQTTLNTADGGGLGAYREFFLPGDRSRTPLFEDWDLLSGSPSWSRGLQALYGSLVISVLSVVAAGLIGIALAFFFEKQDFPGRGLFSALVLLPLTLPPVVGVVSFDLLFSESGIIPRALGHLLRAPSPPVYLAGKGGIVAVHGYAFSPFFFLLVSDALRNMDASLLEASRGMGAGRWRTLFRVEWPMLTPALFGASVMVFMMSMASFSAPLLFDVDGMYLSTHIYNLKNQNLLQEAYTATTIFALTSLGALLVLRGLRGSKKYQSVGKGLPRRRATIRSPLGRISAALAGTGVLFLILLPHLAILLWSLARDGTWTYQILPPEYTLENYFHLFGIGAGGLTVFEPVRNSLWMAAVATAANLCLGVAAAIVLKSRDLWGKTVTDLLVMLPWALPGTVIAVNLIVAFSRPNVLSLGFDLANSVFLLPIAYFVRNIPLVVRPLVAAWERWGEELEEASRSLGAGRIRTLFRVSLPVAFSALAAGGLLAFVTALGEFVASAILYTPRNKPISMAIFLEFHSGAYGTCAAYGVLLIVLIAGVMILGRRNLQGSAL